MARGDIKGMYLTLKGTPFKGISHNSEGNFTSQGQKDLVVANKEIAQVAQNYVANVIKNNLRRKSVSSGRLYRVTLMPDNIRATPFYLGVGNEKFLDGSVAKYWRTIELGSKVTWKKRSFLSLDLRGTFGATLGPTVSWKSGRGPSAGPVYASGGGGVPENPAGKFHPTGKFFTNPETGVRSRMMPFFPGHEIAGNDAYLLARRQAVFTNAGINAARRFIAQAIRDDVVHRDKG